MVRKLLAVVVIGSLAGLAGQAGAEPQPVHEAEIAITKTTIKRGKVTVTVSITGFAVAGHWDLSWRRIGKPANPRNKIHVLKGTTGRTPTLVPGRWQLTASLVDPKHKVFSATQYPNSKFTARKVVRAR